MCDDRGYYIDVEAFGIVFVKTHILKQPTLIYIKKLREQ